ATTVGDVRSAYDHVPPHSLSGACLSAAVSGEDAMNAYITAYTTWNNCVSDSFCSTDSIDPELQSSWSRATAKIGKAKSAYARVGLTAGPDRNWTETVPLSADDVDHTVYGRAVSRICTSDVPLEATEPCSDLRSVLADGVDK